MRPAMLVSGIRLVANGDRCELQADVRTAARKQPFLLWFREIARLRRKNAKLRAKLARSQTRLRTGPRGGLSLLISAWRGTRERLGGGPAGWVARALD
jgi:hypothetical protein